jgi:7-cyano-7-deazaguanine synthase in queuosine biosynthesis
MSIYPDLRSEYITTFQEVLHLYNSRAIDIILIKEEEALGLFPEKPLFKDFSFG